MSCAASATRCRRTEPAARRRSPRTARQARLRALSDRRTLRKALQNASIYVMIRLKEGVRVEQVEAPRSEQFLTYYRML